MKREMMMIPLILTHRQTLIVMSITNVSLIN